jgi:hypothetical protein
MKEPERSDFIYEEIRQCEEYALLNLVTFEAAIRNPKVLDILKVLDSVSSRKRLSLLPNINRNDAYLRPMHELKEEYFLDYFDYLEYTKRRESFLESHTIQKVLSEELREKANKIQSLYPNETVSVKHLVGLYKKKSAFNLHVNHNNHTSHTHNLVLPLYRPKMAIPQQESSINITIPMYHVHPKDIKVYYERLLKKHLEIVEEASDYYLETELFYDIVDETKSKSSTYADMFFTWDYLTWRQSNDVGLASTSTSTMTRRSMYEELASSHPDTGRVAIIEKYVEKMNKLIRDCEYKQYYIPKKVK